jgi:protoheme IX farnesyltransferase
VVRRGITGLLRASHPEPTVAVTAMAVALAITTGRAAAGVVAVGAAVLAGHLAIGWHNDWYDADRDRTAGRSDKPIAGGLVSSTLVARSAVVAAIAVVPLSFLSGWRAALAHLAGVALAFAYNMRLKASVWSLLPYVVAFPLLVAFVTLGQPGHPWPPWWALVTAALLGAGAHLVNAVPDLAGDVASGVNGLPQRMGRTASVAVSAGLLLAGSAVVAFGPGHPGLGAVLAVVAAAAVVGFGLVAGRRPGSRWLFRAALIVALIDAALLVARGNAL